MPYAMSRTEEVIRALVASIDRELRKDSFPECRRNEMMETVAESLGTSGGALCNVVDGNAADDNEMLGADEVPGGFEIVHVAEVEWLVIDPNPKVRDERFDRGMILIDDAIKAAFNDAELRTLGGVVDDARIIVPIERMLTHEIGLPGGKAVSLRVQLTFTSDRIF